MNTELESLIWVTISSGMISLMGAVAFMSIMGKLTNGDDFDA